MTPSRLDWAPAGARLYAGVARVDITPPVGIYARMWGAAEHDRAQGVHRPLSATVLAFRQGADQVPLLLVSLDWVHIPGQAELALLRDPLLGMVDGDSARIILACTHTHAAGLMALERSDQPGGELIEPYLQAVAKGVCQAACHAIHQSRTTACTLTWATGRCGLAANRDLPWPEESRMLCGFHPDGPADDTLVAGRLTADSDGRVLATLVNYACHPTTLAWENRLLSPDYVGAMRELVESHTGGAPCAFFQGASGELAPRLQYVGDPAVADAHGRELGFAVLSTLAGMQQPGHGMTFDRVVESGAPLAVWGAGPMSLPNCCQAVEVDVPLPVKPLLPAEQLRAELAACSNRVQAERLRRKLHLLDKLGQTGTMPAWCWQLGDGLLLAHPNEAYSDLQRQLRAALHPRPVMVMNVANGSCGYLYPQALADQDCYPVWQSPFTGEALEVLIEQAAQTFRRMLA